MLLWIRVPAFFLQAKNWSYHYHTGCNHDTNPHTNRGIITSLHWDYTHHSIGLRRIHGGIAGILIGLILILGYIPPFKKYLPKKIKKRPLIECSAQKIGLKDQENHGSYKKNMLSTFIPYKPETGRITFSPSGHKKSISVKAAGKGAMFVTNTRTYAGKTEVTFNGTSIEEGRTKPLRISGNSTISLSTTEYIYTCYLNR